MRPVSLAGSQMLDKFFQDPRVLQRLRASVLGTALDDLAAHLHGRRYSPYIIQKYSRAAAHFAYWLEHEGIAISTLNGGTVRRFLDEHLSRCRCPVPSGGGVLHVRPALDHLLWLLARQHIPQKPRAAVVDEPQDAILERFEAHLRQTCGVAPSTCQSYMRQARAFLRGRFGAGSIDLTRLSPADLTNYVTARAGRVKPGTAKELVNALRSFVRCLGLHGLCDARLVQAVPTVPHWKLSHLPKALTDEQVRVLLGSFDRETALGLRGYAMALCLVRLGLRACEVARLCLDDIDWRPGTVRITGKRGRVRLLPLPPDVGRAIVAYLRRARVPTADRHLFVRHRIPVGEPLESQSVQATIRTAWKRAGVAVPSKGTHALRHTLATRLLRSGATLKEIADVLGHRSIDTTAVYAKLDLDRLAEVALPWPAVR